MELAKRMDLLVQLQAYMISSDARWQATKEKAYAHNGWFIPPFIDLAAQNIATHLLSRSRLQVLIEKYNVPSTLASPKNVGIVLPGNVPLAGFQDFLLVFLSGHRQRIKSSAKDDVLLRHLVQQMAGWEASVTDYVSFEDMLKGCDAYMAPGASQARKGHGYLEQYFGKYPGIIHKTGTAVAVLNGMETRKQLELLADDVFQYFGRGCLNVTKLYVPRDYDFIPLLKAFEKYEHLIDHDKYKNNYDYQLSMLILNKRFYMTNGSLLLIENASPFSPVGSLHYEFYDLEREAPVIPAGPQIPSYTVQAAAPSPSRDHTPDFIPPHQPGVQSFVGHGHNPFGLGQQSVICENAEEPHALQFLLEL